MECIAQSTNITFSLPSDIWSYLVAVLVLWNVSQHDSKILHQKEKPYIEKASFVYFLINI